jgi:hypothetical protein
MFVCGSDGTEQLSIPTLITHAQRFLIRSTILVRMLGKLAKALAPEGRLEEGGGRLHRLRTLATSGVVVASVCSAMSVLVGAVYDEHGSQEDAVYRQQLVVEQQLERLREESIAADVGLFGGYEQHVLGARDLQRDAAVMAANRRLAEALRSRAEDQRTIATALLTRFHVHPWEATNGPGLSYDPSIAYRVQSRSVSALEEALDPGVHRLDARSSRHKGMSMAGVAALFLIALVLFTIAQVYTRIRTPETEALTPEAEAEAEVPTSALRHAYALLGTGTLLLIVATIVGLNAAI